MGDYSDFTSDFKYNEIKKCFQRLFNKKHEWENFNRTPWFLYNGTKIDEMYYLLKSLCSELDLADKYKIRVSDFINRISLDLYNYHMSSTKCSEQIFESNAYVKTRRLDFKIRNTLGKSQDPNFTSKIQISLARIDNFPKGSYSFTLEFSCKEDDGTFRPKKLFFKDKHHVDLVQEANIAIIPELDNKYRFDPIDIKVIDDTINLYYFRLLVQKNGLPFAESKLIYFDEVYKSLIEEFVLAEKFFYSLYKITLEPKLPTITEEFEVTLDIKFELNYIEFMAILNKAFDDLNRPISKIAENNEKIEELLKYFPEIRDEIYQIFNIDTSQMSCCNTCESCIIY
jgi:hypothetical protein